MTRSAQQIYKDVMDHISGAIVEFDPDVVDQYMAVPHVVVTSTARRVLTTRSELHEAIASFGHSLGSLNLTSFRQDVHECQFITETLIHGHHTNHFENAGKPVINSYPSMSKLELHDGQWKRVEVQSAVENCEWPLLVPQVGIEQDADEFGPHQRLGIVQDMLDDISVAFVTGDTTRWAMHVELPFTMISSDGPAIFETEDELRRDFERYTHEIRSNGITEIVRKAIRTQMVGNDQMIATYRTYILRGSQQVVPSWEASATLRVRDGKWRVGTILRNIGHHNWSAVTAGDIENISKTTPNSGETK